MQQKVSSFPLTISMCALSYILQPQFVHALRLDSIAARPENRLKKLNAKFLSLFQFRILSFLCADDFNKCVTKPFLFTGGEKDCEAWAGFFASSFFEDA